MEPNSLSSVLDHLNLDPLPKSFSSFASTYQSIFVTFRHHEPHPDMSRAERLERTGQMKLPAFILALGKIRRCIDSTAQNIQKLQFEKLPENDIDIDTFTRRLHSDLDETLQTLETLGVNQLKAVTAQIVEYNDIDIDDERQALDEKITELETQLENCRQIRVLPDGPTPFSKRIAHGLNSVARRARVVIKFSLGKTSDKLSGQIKYAPQPTLDCVEKSKASGDQTGQLIEVLEQDLESAKMELQVIREINERAERAQSAIGTCQIKWKSFHKSIESEHRDPIQELIPTSVLSPTAREKLRRLLSSLHTLLVRVRVQMDEILQELNTQYGPGSDMNLLIDEFRKATAIISRFLKQLSSTQDMVPEPDRVMFKREVRKLAECFEKQLCSVEDVLLGWINYSQLNPMGPLPFIADVERLVTQETPDSIRESGNLINSLRKKLDARNEGKKDQELDKSVPSRTKLTYSISDALSSLTELEHISETVSKFSLKFGIALVSYHGRASARPEGATPTDRDPEIFINSLSINPDAARSAFDVLRVEIVRLRNGPLVQLQQS